MPPNWISSNLICSRSWYARLSQDLVGGIGATWRFRIAKTILLWYPQWLPQHPSWSSSVVSSPGALLQVTYAMVWWLWSVPHQYVHQYFHIFTSPSESYPGWLPWRPSWKSLIVICSWTVSRSGTLVEDIGAAWRFRTARMFPFWCPRWLPWQPSWKSSNHICSQTASLIELKFDGRLWGIMEIQNF